MILGAATGILSGGVTLVGRGAAVGAVGAVGWFAQAPGHDRCSQTGSEQYLQSSGTAVVVMADEDEVGPTKAQLASLGGKVRDYEVPKRRSSRLRKRPMSKSVGGKPEDHVNAQLVEVAEEEDIPPAAVLKGPVRPVRGIGPERHAALATIGIASGRSCWIAAQRPKAEPIAEQSKSATSRQYGVSAVDLTRVWASPQSAELLQAAGVVTVAGLAQQDAASLHEQLVTINPSRHLVRVVPGVSRIAKAIGRQPRTSAGGHSCNCGITGVFGKLDLAWLERLIRIAESWGQ